MSKFQQWWMPKSKSNICTEDYLNNILAQPQKRPLTILQNYNFALYFIQLKHCAHFTHVLTDFTEVALS